MDKSPEVKVVFDTSIIANGTAHIFLSRGVVALIQNWSENKRLNVTWYLPEVVVRERRFQMKDAAGRKIGAWQEVQRLLGNDLSDSSEATIASKVEEAIDRSMMELNLQRLLIDTKRVDWDDVILAATDRLEPFSATKEGKGFRDKLISETFFQLVRDSIADPKECLVFFAVTDDPFFEYMQGREPKYPNTRIVKTTEELEGQFNRLVEKLDEAQVARLQKIAKEFFFKTFWRDAITEIRAKYEMELQSRPGGFERRENGDIYLGHPEFLKREDERYYWASKITVSARGYVRDVGISQPPSGSRVSGTSYPLASSTGGSSQALDPFVAAAGLSMESFSTTPPVPRMILIQGRSIFKVIWSARVETGDRFADSKIEEITSEGTSW